MERFDEVRCYNCGWYGETRPAAPSDRPTGRGRLRANEAWQLALMDMDDDGLDLAP